MRRRSATSSTRRSWPKARSSTGTHVERRAEVVEAARTVLEETGADDKPPVNPIIDWHELFSTEDEGEDKSDDKPVILKLANNDAAAVPGFVWTMGRPDCANPELHSAA